MDQVIDAKRILKEILEAAEENDPECCPEALFNYQDNILFIRISRVCPKANFNKCFCYLITWIVRTKAGKCFYEHSDNNTIQFTFYPEADIPYFYTKEDQFVYGDRFFDIRKIKIEK